MRAPTYKNRRRLSVALGVAALSSAMLPEPSHAANSWDLGNGLKIDWTNSIRYNAAFRLQDQDRKLLANPNLDDGNRNFDKGLISNRLELFTELDAVSADGWGARVSALGWYDFVYNRSNDNPGFAGGAFPNHTSTDHDEFTDDTRDQHGRDAEIRDAFVFGEFGVAQRPLTVRLGQHALVWGESVFFASNAVAGAQSPFDVTRLLDDPTAEAKEFVLPVPQVSAQWQLTDDLTLGAYYQFRHRKNRIPAVGSYFSVSDVVGEGAERLLLGPTAAVQSSDKDADDSGQFGVQLRWRLGETDLGFYVLRFHDKDFQQVNRLGLVQIPGVPAPQVLPTSYYLTYHEDTMLYGISASRSFGDVNLAAEASIRKDQSLATTHAADASGLPFPGVPGPNDNDENPAYAVGDTAHINVSTIWTVPRTPLWNEANFIGEVAWSRLLSCSKNCKSPAPGVMAAVDPNASRDAVSLRAVFEPTYRQVVTGLDLGVPIGIGYTPKGSRSILGPAAVPPEDGGDVTVGVNGLYLNEWEFNLAYTHFFGSADGFLDASSSPSYTYQQARADRDFISFTVRHSF